jgi:hypothetical protein
MENHIGSPETAGVCLYITHWINKIVKFCLIFCIGQNWGENGYIRILRGENICGIGSQVYQPVISTMTTTSSRASEFYFSLNKCLFVVALCYLLFKIFYL